MSHNRRAAISTGASQVTSSLTNALFTVGAVRLLPVSEFGLLAACFALVLLGQALLRGFLAEPLLTLQGAPTETVEREFIGSLVATVAMMIGVALLAGTFGGEALSPLLWLTLGASCLWLEDGLRFLAFFKGRPQVALLADVLWLLTQSLAVAAVWISGEGGMIFAVLPWSVGASVSLLYIVIALRPGASWISPRAFLARTKRLSLWFIPQFLIGGALTQMLPLLLVYLIGAAQVGFLRAAQLLVMPMAVLLSALNSVLLGQYSRLHAVALRPKLVRASLALGGVSLLFLGSVIAAGPLAFSWLLSDPFPDVLGLLVPLALSIVIQAVALPVGIMLRVHHLGPQILIGQLAGTTTLLVFLLALANRGAVFVAWSMLAQTASIAVASVLMYRKGRRRVVAISA